MQDDQSIAGGDSSKIPGNKTTRRSRREVYPRPVSSKFIIVPLVTFLVGLVFGWLIWGSSGTTAANPQQANAPEKRYQVGIDNNPVEGPDNAPVTIIEFSDYQCPYCIKWYQEVYKQLMGTYKDKVRFVYRDFPLESLHPEARPAAEAAGCAGEQGAYWQFHDALFSQKYELGRDSYLKYAADLGLDGTKFSQCLSEQRYSSEVDADIKAASQIGVNSTPTFFINGRILVGAQPFEAFQQYIDQELAATAQP